MSELITTVVRLTQAQHDFLKVMSTEEDTSVAQIIRKLVQAEYENRNNLSLQISETRSKIRDFEEELKKLKIKEKQLITSSQLNLEAFEKEKIRIERIRSMEEQIKGVLRVNDNKIKNVKKSPSREVWQNLIIASGLPEREFEETVLKVFTDIAM